MPKLTFAAPFVALGPQWESIATMAPQKGPPEAITAWQQMLASCTGAVLTSLTSAYQPDTWPTPPQGTELAQTRRQRTERREIGETRGCGEGRKGRCIERQGIRKEHGECAERRQCESAWTLEPHKKKRREETDGKG